MNEPESLPYARRRPPETGGESVLLSLVSAGLFLYVGFGMGLVGISGDAIYDGSVAGLTWGSRVVGFGILVTTAMAYLRVPGVRLLDFLLAALATVGCLAIGAIWLVFNDMQGVLLVLFGVLNASAARGAWQRWQAHRVSDAGDTLARQPGERPQAGDEPWQGGR